MFIPCCPLSIADSVCPIPGPMTIYGGKTSGLISQVLHDKLC